MMLIDSFEALVCLAPCLEKLPLVRVGMFACKLFSLLGVGRKFSFYHPSNISFSFRSFSEDIEQTPD